MNNIGELIKTYRKEKGMSQLDLALKIGWENPSTLSRIESGEVKPTRETILKIGDALNLSREEISFLMKSSDYAEIEPCLEKK